MQQPPLLPEEALARVARLARFDGLSVLVLGALFAIGAAAARDVPFAALGLLAAGAGAVELHGLALLGQHHSRGMSWLIASQPFLLVVILSYCALRLTFVEIPPMPDEWRAMFELSAQRVGLTPAQYFLLLNRITVGVVAVVSVFYQGGMTLYYLRRRAAVARALQ
jgi:hypothetical protein